MVQDKDGNAPEFQAAMQGFSVLRGCVNALILFLLAGPLAQFFDIPEVLWAFQLIAVVPLVAGFVHFDVHRLSRQMNFLPSVMIAILPPIGSLISVWPFYVMFGDYRTLLFAIFVQMSLTVLVSHIFAKRRYRITFDGAVIMRSLRFGWPLMVGGALMFVVFNGERGIIGRELGLETLALFSMALSLTLTPTLVIARSTLSFFLPQLSAALGSKSYAGLTTATFQTHILLGCTMVVGVALLGGPFLYAVLGEKYAAAIPLLTLLAVVQAFRVFEAGCAIVALAAAHTKNEMMANIVRVALLPVAWIVVSNGGDVRTVIWIGMLGEAAGFAVGLTLALRMQNLALRPLLAPLGVALVLLAVACVHAGIQVAWMPDWRSSVVLVLILACLVPLMPALRNYLRQRSASGHQEES
jgi:O-antigen/teichoic acid export membrane protein